MRRWPLLAVGAPLALAGACSSFEEDPAGGVPDSGTGAETSLATDGGPSPDGGLSAFSERWAKRMGGDGEQSTAALGVDQSANIVFTGLAAEGVLDFGCDAGPPAPDAGNDGYLAKFRGDGTCAWAQRIGGPGNQGMTALSVRGDGKVYATGITSGGGTSFFIGPTMIDHRSGYGSFAVTYESNGALVGGETIYTVATSDNSLQLAFSIAALDDRFVWAGNTTRGFTADGITALATGGTNADAFVGRRAGWLRTFGKAGTQTPHALAVGKDNEIYVAGDFNGQVLLPDGGAVSATPGGSFDAVLSKLDSSGNPLWVATFGNATGQRIQSLFVDKADDTVLFAGDTVGTLQIGNATLTIVDNAVFFGKATSAGELLWASAVPVTAPAKNARIAVKDGRVLLGATVSGKADCGGGPLEQGGDEDFFLCLFDEKDGRFLAGRAFGAPGDQALGGLAWTPDGDIVIGGSFKAPFSIGASSLASTGDSKADIFLARLAPPP